VSRDRWRYRAGGAAGRWCCGPVVLRAGGAAGPVVLRDRWCCGPVVLRAGGVAGPVVLRDRWCYPAGDVAGSVVLAGRGVAGSVVLMGRCRRIGVLPGRGFGGPVVTLGREWRCSWRWCCGVGGALALGAGLRWIGRLGAVRPEAVGTGLADCRRLSSGRLVVASN
jgi:hypothetical protein